MKPCAALRRGLLSALVVSSCFCSFAGASLHGLGGEGYSVWTGNEHKHEEHGHNCKGHHHDHNDHHPHHQAEHIHNHPDEDVAEQHGHSHKGHRHSGSTHSHKHEHDHSSASSGHSHPKTLEELEAEEMAAYGFSTASEDDFLPLSTWERIVAQLGTTSWGTWAMAMGSSLAVSLCSLICLIILPFILREGQTPSEGVVRILTGFGAGAMVGDAFLHQLPHAFGSGGGGHSHEAHSHGDHSHEHGHEHGHDHGSGGHAHSIEDLSVGLAVLVGLIVFFLVEKAVRYVEEATARNPEIAKQISFQKQHSHKHGGHSHHESEEPHEASDGAKTAVTKEETDDQVVNGTANTEPEGAKKRKGVKKDSAKKGEEEGSKSADSEGKETKDSQPKVAPLKPTVAPGSLLVLGYLNLFSDGVHNFTDGMALGAAFVHHGAVGGWSRTLFMLAHELPQEVGDFGILVRAGFSVTKALALNFLSASMAMAGTALALTVGGDASNSSIIEGFTAGGFVYIAVAGVMPDLHAQGTSALITLQQVLSMLAGMGVALAISLWE